MLYCMYCCKLFQQVDTECEGPYYAVRQSKHEVEMVPMKHIRIRNGVPTVDKKYMNKMYLKYF
jgi:hypothetical protein